MCFMSRLFFNIHRKPLSYSLVGLTGTYVKTDSDNFMFTHETLQKIVLRCIAKTIIKSVIKYCKTEVILNQLRLNCVYVEQDDFTIEVTAENEDAYFQRRVYEFEKDCNKAIFENEQNKVPQFRPMFIEYMNKYLSREYWTKTQGDMPALHVVSSLGYHDYTTFFLQDNKMINQKDSDGNIPLHSACMKGHTTIVKSLVENNFSIKNNAGINQKTMN
ncbi:unnamed protein product [Mytilus coruscus]|uniref:Uncharacterized protein n=1 Tax=Mytilus coruscus TaxID=42192 RepID=A0A6J8ASM5_MYTCO|nr:unnamed protein product [Mytilus coruscus]